MSALPTHIDNKLFKSKFNFIENDELFLKFLARYLLYPNIKFWTYPSPTFIYTYMVYDRLPSINFFFFRSNQTWWQVSLTYNIYEIFCYFSSTLARQLNDIIKLGEKNKELNVEIKVYFYVFFY